MVEYVGSYHVVVSGIVGGSSLVSRDSYGMIYTTNKKFKFHSPNFDSEYRTSECQIRMGGNVDNDHIDNSYGIFELKFLIVYNGIEVGRKNTSSGYFIRVWRYA